jgi:hypothetical protein
MLFMCFASKSFLSWIILDKCETEHKTCKLYRIRHKAHKEWVKVDMIKDAESSADEAFSN